MFLSFFYFSGSVWILKIFFDIIILVIEMDCIFCKIIANEIPSYKLYEDDDILVFLDINPENPGHTLIIPKKHTLDMETIDDNTLMKILNKSRDVAKLLIDKLGADGYSLIQNNGIAQEVKHYHLHVIPKYRSKIKMGIEEVFNILKEEKDYN
jgi:histidine triad (HIT) family protein